MWDSMGNDSCDNCEFTIRRQNSQSSDDQFFKDTLSPDKNEDSLFDGVAALPTSCATDSSPHCPSRRLFDDMDATSQDSGCDTGFAAEHGKLHSYASPSRGQLSSSFGSGSIFSMMEDDILEDFCEIEPLGNNSKLPNDFNKLISDPLVVDDANLPVEKISSPKDTIIRPLFRRALSLQNPPSTTRSSRVRTNLFSDEDKENRPSAKRPEPPTPDPEHGNIKRSKLFKFSTPQFKSAAPSRDLFKRQFSATEESIMSAVQRSSTEPDLIGDYSKSYCLPLINGRHQDLKSITPETLVKLMKGEFKDCVESYKVIDCRYPYEFLGGHINGAVNIYTKEQICELFVESRLSTITSNKRHILVFHCEFSSERGPNLYRFLRNEDRARNRSDYPMLHYPEIYLLEGGYKKFFLQYSEMCVPVAYKEMLHPDHEEDLRHFRQKSKTWNADNRQKPMRSQKRL